MDKNIRRLVLLENISKREMMEFASFIVMERSVKSVSGKRGEKELSIRIELLLTEVDREMDVPKAISLLCAFCNNNTIGFDFC